VSEQKSGADKKQLYLSASRIETFCNCSALYCAKYIWKIPDTGNDGARRGSTAHEILEILANPRHKPVFDAAILHDTCTEVPALWRTVRRIARRFLVDDPVNLRIIDDMILVGLKDQHFGPAGTIEAKAEVEFAIVVRRQDGRYFALRGFIDRLFKVLDALGVKLVTKDYKGSKDVFKGDKVEFNTQSLCYQIAERELYPDIKRREFYFLFLRFPKKARQVQPSFTDEQLDGFEWILTELQRAMEGFTLENASDNFAADDPAAIWLCGREGHKRDGTPAFICSARRPLDYWVTVDEEGQIVASAFTESELKPKKGQRVEQRTYPGCPKHFPR
jgi:hypothetical protein